MHELADGAVRTFTLDPLDVGITVAEPAALVGGDAGTNASVVRAVLGGEKGPARDIAILNAAAGVVVAGLAPDIATGVEVAAQSIDRGDAARALAILVRVSTDAAGDDGVSG